MVRQAGLSASSWLNEITSPHAERHMPQLRFSSNIDETPNVSSSKIRKFQIIILTESVNVSNENYLSII